MQHQIMIFRRCFTIRFRHSGLNSSPGNLLTIMCGPSCKQALLLSWQQSCTSPTTHAGVQAISICGWSQICSDVYSCCTDYVKLEVISLNTLIFKAKISPTHVALNIGFRTGCGRNSHIFEFHCKTCCCKTYVQHCKENAPI